MEEGWATGHFNASELDQFRAIVESCKEIGSPAIVGTSEGERKHLGPAEAVALRDAFRKKSGIPVFLNADHSKSVERAKEAIDADYDSVHIDLSDLSLDENIKGTREIVEYAKGKQVNIEGELGYLWGESQIQKEKIEVKPEDYTDPKEAAEFVKKTGINRLAIAVGNVHGISLDEPELDIDRIKEIRKIIPEEIALVLHAGSGIPDEQIKAAIKAGIANIHINTDLRIAYVRELKKSLEENPEEAAMYKLDASAIKKLKELVKEKLKLFGAINRI
jgi:ketose-bisphosphate aldolase